MEQIGSQLKKIREEKNISFQALKDGTKLQEKILKAIEENQFNDIAPVYLKGFLKIYCKFLGVNPNDFTLEAKQKQKVEVAEVRAAHPEVLPNFNNKKEEVKEKQRIDFNPRWALFIFAIPLVIILGLIFSKPKNAVKQKQPQKIIEVKKSTKSKTAKKQESSKTKNSKNSSLALPIKGALSLTIHAKQNCWLRIKSDGKTVFQNVLQKGSTDTWVAKEKLELAVGNAGGLEFQLNGRVLPSLGSRGQVIKKISITKDGIDINK